MNLNDLLASREWYDNHKLSQMLQCPRKAYFNTVYRGGLEAGVGPGAFAGSVVHIGLAAYYKLWGSSEEDRRHAAFRAMSNEHARRFGDGDIFDKKHRLDNLVDIVDSYFDAFLIEDRGFRPIESEMSAVVTISPQDGDPPDFQTPFMYIIKVDGLWERLSNGDWFVEETKTTSSGAERELVRLAINRQSTGYVYGVRQFPDGDRVKGVLANVLLVAVGKRDFRRDFYYKSEQVLASWRRQTVHLVQRWRDMLTRAKAATDPQEILDIFTQNDMHCTNYGLCPYHAGCYHGLTMLDTLDVNTWVPFEMPKEV